MPLLTTTYEVAQKGLVLSCEKIAINKYENKITKLHFTFDDNVTGSRHYAALLNPVTKTYKIHPLDLNDTATLTAEISRYPGIWQLILIATDDDYEIIDDDIDQTKCTYVSNTAKFILVRDNFLSDDTMEYEDTPAIQQLIDETVAMRDQLEAYALGANEDYNKAHSEAERAALFADECGDIQAVIENMSSVIEGYKADAERMRNIAEAWAVGRSDVPETVDNNAKYYSEVAKAYAQESANISGHVEVLRDEVLEAESNVKSVANNISEVASSVEEMQAKTIIAVAGFDAHVDEARENFDTYYEEKKDALKGEKGDVQFASFKVVDGHLIMYSDPNLDNVVFYREGSRLKYRLNI